MFVVDDVDPFGGALLQHDGVEVDTGAVQEKLWLQHSAHEQKRLVDTLGVRVGVWEWGCVWVWVCWTVGVTEGYY